MLYAERDENGKIVALFNNQNENATESVTPNDQEVIDFLLAEQDQSASLEYLSQTDTRMVRIIEDLVHILIEKNLIMFTDLPGEAQKKINTRRQLRDNIQDNEILLSDEDTLL